MKNLIFGLILLSTCQYLYTQDTTFANSRVLIQNDTLNYYWQIKNYPDSVYGKFDLDLPLFNGKIWLSSLRNGSNAYLSNDNLNTWKKCIVPGDYFNKRLFSYCLLPDNRVFATVNSLVNNKLVDGILYESNDITKNWNETNIETFKNKPINSINFKDNLHGIVSVSDSLTFRQIYRTDNGGKDWYKLENISNILSSDNYLIKRIEYFEESGILMCIVYNLNTKYNYFIFSKDYGDNWSELISFPKQTKNSLDYISNSGFYMRNDSLWFAGAIGTGRGVYEAYECIYFTPDLGKTWQAQYLSIGAKLSDYFSSVEFFDNSLVGLVCERSPRILITFDGGEHWTWLSHQVTNFGKRGEDDAILDKQYGKFKLKKANNKMIFFGYNKIFMFIHLNLPTSVDDKNDYDVLVHYNPKIEAIELSYDSNFPIENITLYDITGRELFNANNITNNHFYITKDKLQNTKVVFAIIQTNNQMFLKQLICE